MNRALFAGAVALASAVATVALLASPAEAHTPAFTTTCTTATLTATSYPAGTVMDISVDGSSVAHEVLTKPSYATAPAVLTTTFPGTGSHRHGVDHVRRLPTVRADRPHGRVFLDESKRDDVAVNLAERVLESQRVPVVCSRPRRPQGAPRLAGRRAPACRRRARVPPRRHPRRASRRARPRAPACPPPVPRLRQPQGARRPAGLRAPARPRRTRAPRRRRQPSPRPRSRRR